jgi:hypothetical protein
LPPGPGCEGDTPHPAGCVGQAWGVTETLRVCRTLAEVVIPPLIVATGAWKQLDRGTVIAPPATDVQALAAQPTNLARQIPLLFAFVDVIRLARVQLERGCRVHARIDAQAAKAHLTE